MTSLDPHDEHALLTHLRNEVARSRFNYLDERIIGAVSNEAPGQRLVEYLDRFIVALEDQNSGHAEEIERTLRTYLDQQGERFEGVFVEVSRMDQEVLGEEIVPLRSLGDFTDFIARMRSIRSLIIADLDSHSRGSFNE